jgi:hypothetical protein
MKMVQLGFINRGGDKLCVGTVIVVAVLLQGQKSYL